MGISLQPPRVSPQLLFAILLTGSTAIAANEYLSTHSGNDKLLSGLLAGGLGAGAIIGAHAYQSGRDQQSQIETLRARIAQLSQGKASLKTEIERLRRQLTQAELDAQALSEAKTKLEVETIHGLAQAENRVQSASQLIQAKDAQLATVQGELAAAKDQAGTLRSKVLAWEQTFNERLGDKIEDLEIEHTQRIETLEGAYAEKKSQLEKDIRLRADKAIERRLDNLVTKRHNQIIEDLRAALADKETMLQVTSQELERAKLSLNHLELETRGLDQVKDAELDTFEAAVEERDQRIEKQRRTIVDLTEKLADAKRPRLFPAKQTDFPGNHMIKVAYESQGIILDAAHREMAAGKTTYYFNYRGDANPTQAIQPLNAHLTAIKEHLALLDIEPFRYNTEKLLVECTVVTQKRILTDNDVDRYWTPRSQFKGLCSDFHRVRITGASEGAKSPLARNILGAKLLNGEKFIIRRMDPSAGSRKDYWRIAPEWTDYQDAKTIAREINQTIQQRKAKLEPIELYVYFVLDEIDNTMTNISDADRKAYATAIKNILKEGSHVNVGCIVSGQNPNASNYPGFQRGDFNSAVNLHIEKNIPDALMNSNDGSKMTKLMSDYTALLEYCETKNKGIPDITQKYRFAMLEDGKSARKMIELPTLGYYGFDQFRGGDEYEFDSFSTADYPDSIRTLDEALSSRVSTKTNTTPSGSLRRPLTAVNDSQLTAAIFDELPEPSQENGFSEAVKLQSTATVSNYVGFDCIKCQTGKYSRRMLTRGVYSYLCDTCGKKSSENLIEQYLTESE